MAQPNHEFGFLGNLLWSLLILDKMTNQPPHLFQFLGLPEVYGAGGVVVHRAGGNFCPRPIFGTK